jgi:predicted RNA methylase
VTDNSHIETLDKAMIEERKIEVRVRALDTLKQAPKLNYLGVMASINAYVSKPIYKESLYRKAAPSPLRSLSPLT